MKKTLSILLICIMLLSMLPMATFAAEANSPSLTIDSVDATPGDTASVNINLKNNPGIVAATINVSFDEGLTLVGAANGSVFPPTMQFVPPKQLSTVGSITGNCNFQWNGTDIDDADIKDGVSFEQIKKAYEDYYKDEFFIRLLDDGKCADIHNVRYSNFCDISLHHDKRANKLVACAAIDNMVKGAAGQAIQNMNIIFGLDEKTGLVIMPPAF